MALWSTKRRFIYGGTVALVLVLILGGISWKLFYSAPTCSDGVMNGEERGVDCGGSCKNLCTVDTLTPITLWSKVFNISGDVYSAVAYVENPNVNSENSSATYQFRVYDDNQNIIFIKEGEVSIPKGKKFAVFENGLILRNAKPRSADFKFLTFSTWQKDTSTEPSVSITHGSLENYDSSPRVTGTVTNTSSGTIPDMELVVFVIDSNENVIGASRTFIEGLPKNGSEDFVVTWQKPFDREAKVVNVIYRVL